MRAWGERSHLSTGVRRLGETWVASTPRDVIQSSYMTRTDRRDRPLKASLEGRDCWGADVTIEQMRAAVASPSQLLRRAQWDGSRLRRGLSQLGGTAAGSPSITSWETTGGLACWSIRVVGNRDPGTLIMPFTAVDDGTEKHLSKPIGMVALRDALSLSEWVSSGGLCLIGEQVNLVPLRYALEEQPEGSLIMFRNEADRRA